jgi:hypothetical protein
MASHGNTAAHTGTGTHVDPTSDSASQSDPSVEIDVRLKRPVARQHHLLIYATRVLTVTLLSEKASLRM